MAEVERGDDLATVVEVDSTLGETRLRFLFALCNEPVGVETVTLAALKGSDPEVNDLFDAEVNYVGTTPEEVDPQIIKFVRNIRR